MDTSLSDRSTRADTRARSVSAAALPWAATAAVVLCVSFLGLGDAGFWGRDEGRYAEIAREMVESGDWVTPRLVFVKYFEKPPLLYWLTALSFGCLGTSELAGRLPSVLGGLLALGGIGLLAFRFGGTRLATTSTMVLATSLLFFIMGRTLTTDALLTGCYAVALVGAFFAVESAREQAGRWLLLFAVGSALAVLTKGIIGVVLPVTTILAYAALARRRPSVAWQWWLAAGALWCAIVLPWFVLVSLRNPEFVHYFIVVQHIERFLGDSQEHLKPWWFFLPITLAALLPWTPALFARGREERGSPVARLRLFLWLWAAVVVGFFSLSSCKLVSYIVPALPALAILIALNLSRERPEGERQGAGAAGWAGALFWLLFGAGAALYAYRQDDLPLARVVPLAGWLAAACVVAAAAFAYWTARRPSGAGVLLPVLATALPWLTLNTAAANLAPELGHRAMCVKAKEQMQPGDETALFRQYDPGFVFYTRQRPVIFGVKNELAFGMEQEPMGDWYREGDEAFVELMRGPRRVFCFTNDANFEAAKQLASPVYVVSRAKKRVIFSNRPTTGTPTRGAR